MVTIESLGKYEIKQALGRGAMGTVYEAWDPVIARRVAIKTVRLHDADEQETEEALARFRQEAQAAGRLMHPNIVSVFDYGETNDLAYIVMEFVDGPPLKRVLDQQERFALPDALRIMQDLLAGLQFSHERGVVHRDVKPANVMLTSGGQAKIADFGIARIENSTITQAGTLLGTPAYMSPEQLTGQVVDARTDIYSSGVLLYQLLTGERPFDGGMSAIMHKALNAEAVPPSQISVTVPQAFDAVVRRAMAKRPGDRFPTAKAFAEAIHAASVAPMVPLSAVEMTLMAPAAVSRPPPAPPRAAPVTAPRRRSRMPLIGAAVVVVLVAGGGGTWWFVSRSPAPAPVIVSSPTPEPSAAPPTPLPVPASPAAPVPAAQPPPASAPPTPTPAPQPSPLSPQPPKADAAELRAQIGRWASTRRCALLGGDVAGDGAVALDGLAGRSEVDTLREGALSFAPAAPLDWRVTGVDPVFCPVLDVLRPLVPAFGATNAPRLGLTMADGKTRLHDGERVRVQLTMPDFTGWLRVDYVAHNGLVQHLYPQLAEPKDQIAADTPRKWAAGEPVNLADPHWEISAPYGTDMIIAVVSSRPLLSRPRRTNAETIEDYVRDLQAAVDAALQRGERLAGAAITLDALQ